MAVKRAFPLQFKATGINIYQLVLDLVCKEFDCRTWLSIARLSGGFLLSVLQGCKTSWHDLDFFCTHDTEAQWFDGFEDSHCTNYYFSPDIENVGSCQIDCGRIRGIDIVTLLPGISLDDHIRTFDLSFCQNYLDAERLVCFEPQSVIKKEATFKALPVGRFSHEYLALRLDRLQKYIRLGYSIKLHIPKALEEECSSLLYIACRFYGHMRSFGSCMTERAICSDAKASNANWRNFIRAARDLVSGTMKDGESIVQYFAVDGGV